MFPGLHEVETELDTAGGLAKCLKCGCMSETLEALAGQLSLQDEPEFAALTQKVTVWRTQLLPAQYACLGCAHCHPAAAQNSLADILPLAALTSLACNFRAIDETWPPVAGDYVVVDTTAAVAVSTLASVELASALAERRPAGLAIVGKTETENIGIDKVVKNVITNVSLRYLVVTGREPEGHHTGQTLLALFQNGVEQNGRVIGATGRRPILRNVTADEIAAFRAQIQIIDLIGCEDIEIICRKVEELPQAPAAACGCSACAEIPEPRSAVVAAATMPPDSIPLDKSGYFVILLQRDRHMILAEHYSYENKLLRTIEGQDARAICHTIVTEGWVTDLGHAAYLGRELAKAELALQGAALYTQDGA
jgi:tetrahydromethanopterin S-methyltransferase subunit A